MNTKTVALITGGNSGIGAQIAKRLAKDNIYVAINYLIDEEKAKNVKGEIITNGGKCEIFKADITNKTQVDEMIGNINSVFGDVDILINNASPPAIAKNFIDTELDEFNQHFEVTFFAHLYIIKKVVAKMKDKGSGIIISILTTYILNTPPAKLSPYICAKEALHALSKTLAVELGPYGIRVNMVSPGLVDTEFTAHIPSKYKELLANQIPLRRICTKEDASEVISFLCSPEAKYLNGVNIPLSGGLNII